MIFDKKFVLILKDQKLIKYQINLNFALTELFDVTISKYIYKIINFFNFRPIILQGFQNLKK